MLCQSYLTAVTVQHLEPIGIEKATYSHHFISLSEESDQPKSGESKSLFWKQRKSHELGGGARGGAWW